MGKYISSKKQYLEEMAKGNYVPYEEGNRLAEKAQSNKRKDYKGMSSEARDLVNWASQTKDRKGNIKPTEKFVEGLKKVGVSFNFDHCPEHYKDKGGFK